MNIALTFIFKEKLDLKLKKNQRNVPKGSLKKKKKENQPAVHIK